LVDYSGVDIPAILEEELDSESDSENDETQNSNYFAFNTSFLSQCTRCYVSKVFFLPNTLKHPLSNFSSKLYLEVRNFRI
jgi:hypothetical protein